LLLAPLSSSYDQSVFLCSFPYLSVSSAFHQLWTPSF
jgi:hypothetical protein